MPKARRRKGTVHKSTTRIHSEGQRRDTSVTASTATDEPTEQTSRAARRIEQRSRTSSYQSLIMPGMVTLGCLGLAISFSFFTTDPNRFLYGGIAALMALMWGYSFWMRLRKVSGKEKQ
jgi:hypothetical protein